MDLVTQKRQAAEHLARGEQYILGVSDEEYQHNLKYIQEIHRTLVHDSKMEQIKRGTLVQINGIWTPQPGFVSFPQLAINPLY